MEPIDFAAFKALVSEYTLEKVAGLTGVEKGFLEELAELDADPDRKVMSLWTMGFNQHVRGVWANHLIYNIHLLTGKIAEPGNSPFADRPAFRVRHGARGRHLCPPSAGRHGGHQPRAPQACGGIWKLPWGYCPKSRDTMPSSRTACSRTASSISTGYRSTTTSRPRPIPATRLIPAIAIGTISSWFPTFIRPSPPARGDIVLPAAMWVEKEGAYGNAERRTHVWHQLVQAPGDARSDLWQMVEFSKHFTTEEVWPEPVLDANPAYRGKTLHDVLLQKRCRRQVPEKSTRIRQQ